MENDRSNDVSKRGISGILAGVLGLVYSVGVLTIFILASVSVDESETELKKSWLRLTYLVFFFHFVGIILWISGIAKRESGFMTSALFFFGTIMVYWMNDIFRELLYYYAKKESGAYVDKSFREFRIRVCIAVFFMVFYFVLMACYSSLKNSYKRLTPEHQHIAGDFDWKVAGFGVSLLMLAFIIGATRFCLLLPSIFVFVSVISFCVINLVMTFIWWLGIINEGRKRMLSNLIFWGIFFTLLIILEIYSSYTLSKFSMNVAYFTAAFFIAAYCFAGMTYFSIMKAKRSGLNMRSNLEYSIMSNGNKELNV